MGHIAGHIENFLALLLTTEEHLRRYLSCIRVERLGQSESRGAIEKRSETTVGPRSKECDERFIKDQSGVEIVGH